LPNGTIQRTGTYEDASNCWIELVQLATLKRKQWITGTIRRQKLHPGVVGKSSSRQCDSASAMAKHIEQRTPDE
jgi:hypothetical protein